MDYPRQLRLKVYGRADVIDVRDQPEAADTLAVPGYPAIVERVVTVTVVAYDWNCPQHITPRYTLAELHELTAPCQDPCWVSTVKVPAACSAPNHEPHSGPALTAADGDASKRVGWAARRGPISLWWWYGPFPCGLPPNPVCIFSMRRALQRFMPRARRGSRGCGHGMPRRRSGSCAAFLP